MYSEEQRAVCNINVKANSAWKPYFEDRAQGWLTRKEPRTLRPVSLTWILAREKKEEYQWQL